METLLTKHLGAECGAAVKDVLVHTWRTCASCKARCKDWPVYDERQDGRRERHDSTEL